MIQTAYLLSESRGLLCGHTGEYNYLWNTFCMTDQKYMERWEFITNEYNFNLIYGNIQSPYND